MVPTGLVIICPFGSVAKVDSNYVAFSKDTLKCFGDCGLGLTLRQVVGNECRANLELQRVLSIVFVFGDAYFESFGVVGEVVGEHVVLGFLRSECEKQEVLCVIRFCE